LLCQPGFVKFNSLTMSNENNQVSSLSLLQDSVARITRDPSSGNEDDREVEAFTNQSRPLQQPETPPPALQHLATPDRGSSESDFSSYSPSTDVLSAVEVLSGPYQRGMEALIHTTAKNEITRDAQFSMSLAQRKMELSYLGEDDLITRYLRSHIAPAAPVVRPTPMNFLPPPSVATPLKVEDTFSWHYWTPMRPSLDLLSRPAVCLRGW